MHETQGHPPALVFKKGSRSGKNGCVEVALLPDQVLVEDSKLPARYRACHRLGFPPAAWAAFMGSIIDSD